MILIQGSPLQKIPLDIPAVIREASSSPLGIFALILLIVGGVAYIFFRKDQAKVKLSVFTALFLGAVLYGGALFRSSGTSVYRITGRAVDSQTQDPIDGADVRLEWGQSSYEDNTDSDGDYTFVIHDKDSMVPDRIRLSAEKTGYQRFVRTVSNPFLNAPQYLLLHKQSSIENAATTQTSSQAHQLEPTACEQLPNMHSEGGDTAATITFRNASKNPVQVYWLNHDGHEQFWFELMPNSSELTETYLKHPWVVRDLAGKCLEIYQAIVTGSSTAVID